MAAVFYAFLSFARSSSPYVFEQSQLALISRSDLYGLLLLKLWIVRQDLMPLFLCHQRTNAFVFSWFCADDFVVLLI